MSNQITRVKISEQPVATIVRAYRENQGLTLRDFAVALTEQLLNTEISHPSVSNWERGSNIPETDFLLICAVVYQDWRMQFAIDVLCAKLPEVFARDERGRIRILNASAAETGAAAL